MKGEKGIDVTHFGFVFFAICSASPCSPFFVAEKTGTNFELDFRPKRTQRRNKRK